MNNHPRGIRTLIGVLRKKVHGSSWKLSQLKQDAKRFGCTQSIKLHTIPGNSCCPQIRWKIKTICLFSKPKKAFRNNKMDYNIKLKDCKSQGDLFQT
jgi:hypothetical protein